MPSFWKALRKHLSRELPLLFNTAEVLAKDLDSALEEEKQITECSEENRIDGEIYKI